MRLVSLVVAAVVLLAATSAHAVDPSSDLARARARYESGEYRKTADILEPLLYPSPLIRNEEDLKEAHRLLGIAYVYLEEPEKARAEFAALLYIDPDYALDPVLESPEVYAFFESVKTDLAARLDKIRKQKEAERRKAQEEEERRRAAKVIVIEREYRDQAAWKNWVPFGVGQFQNGQRVKGTVFLGTQAVLGGTSLALYMAQALEFGWPTGHAPAPEDVDRVRTMQIIQIGTGGLFILTYAWGVIDAYANQKPSVIERRSEQPVEGGETAPAANQSWRFAPYADPAGGGGFTVIGRF